MAELHGKANRVGKAIPGGDQETCICCGLSPVSFSYQNIEPLPLCCATRDFQYIGSGYILYFSSLVYLVIILIVLFLLNLNKIYESNDANACSTYDPLYPCKDDWIHKLSVANYGPGFDTRAVVGGPQ